MHPGVPSSDTDLVVSYVISRILSIGFPTSSTQSQLSTRWSVAAPPSSTSHVVSLAVLSVCEDVRFRRTSSFPRSLSCIGIFTHQSYMYSSSRMSRSDPINPRALYPPMYHSMGEHLSLPPHNRPINAKTTMSKLFSTSRFQPPHSVTSAVSRRSVVTAG